MSVVIYYLSIIRKILAEKNKSSSFKLGLYGLTTFPVSFCAFPSLAYAWPYEQSVTAEGVQRSEETKVTSANLPHKNKSVTLVQQIEKASRN